MIGMGGIDLGCSLFRWLILSGVLWQKWKNEEYKAVVQDEKDY